MTERHPTRTDVARAIGHLMARQPTLGFVASDGRRHLIPAVATDTVGNVLDKVTAAGGSATVVVGSIDRLELLTMQPAPPPTPDIPTVPVDDVHEDSEMGLLLLLVHEQHGSLTIRRVNRGVTVSVVEDDQLDGDLTPA